MLTVGSREAGRRDPRVLGLPHRMRWVWLALSGTIVVAVSLEVAVAASTSRLLHGFGHPLFWVAVAGCATGIGGLTAIYLIQRRESVPIEDWAAGPACGAVIPVLVGEAWLIGNHTLLVACGVLAASVICIVLMLRRGSLARSTVQWAVAVAAITMVVTAVLWVTPDGLALGFRWSNEEQLNQLVPAANKLLSTTDPIAGSCPEWSPPAVQGVLGAASRLCGIPGQFYITDATGKWSLMYVHNMRGADTCARHLDGPWWETVATDGNDCPTGFTFVSGP